MSFKNKILVSVYDIPSLSKIVNLILLSTLLISSMIIYALIFSYKYFWQRSYACSTTLQTKLMEFLSYSREEIIIKYYVLNCISASASVFFGLLVGLLFTVIYITSDAKINSLLIIKKTEISPFSIASTTFSAALFLLTSYLLLKNKNATTSANTSLDVLFDWPLYPVVGGIASVLISMAFFILLGSIYKLAKFKLRDTR